MDEPQRRVRWSLAVRPADDLRSIARTAGAGGFVAVTCDASAFKNASGTATREVQALLGRNGLAAGACQVGLPGRGLSAGCDADFIVDALRDGIDIARRFGFTCVACDLGGVPHTPVPKRAATPGLDVALLGVLVLPTPDEVARYEAIPARQPPPDAAHVATSHAVLATVAEHADRAGMPVALGSTLATPRDVAALLKNVGCPLFFRDLDTASAVDELRLDTSAVVALDPPLLHVSATDAHAGTGGRRRGTNPGAGDVPFDALFTDLHDAGYAGFVTLPPGTSHARL